MPTRRATAEVVNILAEQVRRLEGSWRAAEKGPGITSGWPSLDRLLPGGAFCRGTLVEWLADGRATGACTLALTAAREACREAGSLVVIDREHEFYPPAALELGIDLARLIIVRPRDKDHAWAVDQALRSPAVAAVLCRPARWDDHTFRRLQLAAETSGCLGLLVRPGAVRGEPSWADLRLLVEPMQSHARGPAAVERRLRVELLRSRARARGGAVELALPSQESERVDEYEKSPLHLASQLAAPATRRRSARA
jgi:hypothetical protein